MVFKSYPLKFNPIYKDYIWGGRRLERLGKRLPEGIVAESWEISGHPDGVSIIGNGEYAGVPFPEYLKNFGELAIGTDLSIDFINDFPLLVKWIDAHQRLSVQVHPNDEYAFTRENGQRGKNEMWYIIEAEPGAQIIYGLKPGTNRQEFAKAAAEGEIEPFLQSIEVSPGDVIEIPAGVVHGLGEGILLVEIQQSSNLTYRLFDYGRLDAQGKSRPLHIEKALDVIDFQAQTTNKIKKIVVSQEQGETVSLSRLVSNCYFTADLHRISPIFNGDTAGKRFFIKIILQGQGHLRYQNSDIALKQGETIFIPAALGHYTIEGDLTLINLFIG